MPVKSPSPPLFCLNAYWTKIGAAWIHDDGEGLNLSLDFIPTVSRVPIIQLNGRYYYRDKRLQQLRAIDNYLDSMEWTDLITAVGPGGFALIWEMPESVPCDEVLNKAATPENMGRFSIWEDVIQHVEKWLENSPEPGLPDQCPDMPPAPGTSREGMNRSKTRRRTASRRR
jgi:hypothetical protein